jgi:hypothetical protein
MQTLVIKIPDKTSLDGEVYASGKVRNSADLMASLSIALREGALTMSISGAEGILQEIEAQVKELRNVTAAARTAHCIVSCREALAKSKYSPKRTDCGPLSSNARLNGYAKYDDKSFAKNPFPPYDERGYRNIEKIIFSDKRYF